VDRSILVRTRHLSSLLAVGLIATLVVPAVASAQSAPEVPLTVPQVRDSDPVVLTGAQFPQWAAPADLTLATPSIAGLQCLGEENGVPSSFLGDTPLTSSDPCTHSSNDDPLVSSQDLLQAEGVPGRPAPGLPLERPGVRADPVPGRRDVHPLPQQQRVRVLVLLRP
jgi:hypothetical protein